jgi:hypothetical protein
MTNIRAVDEATAAQAIGKIEPRFRIFGMTRGQFSKFDLIRAILDQTGPADVWISTWTAAKKDIDGAAWLLDGGQIKSCKFIVDRSFATRQPDYARALLHRFGRDCITVSRIHSKVAIIRNDSWNIVLRSSMNLNKNPRFEHFDIDDDRDLADFAVRFFESIENETGHGLDVSTTECDEAFRRVRLDLMEQGAVAPPPRLAIRSIDCGDMGARGYSADEVEARLGRAMNATEREEYTRGCWQLEDQFRDATIEAALSNDRSAAAAVKAWRRSQSN